MAQGRLGEPLGFIIAISSTYQVRQSSFQSGSLGVRAKDQLSTSVLDRHRFWLTLESFVIYLVETGPEGPAGEELATGRQDPRVSLISDELGMSGTRFSVE